MLVFSIIWILFSNAVNLRGDLAIVYNRIAIITLIYCTLLGCPSLTMITKGIGLHGGLLLYTNLNHIFQIFLLIVTVIILMLTSFFPGKIQGIGSKSYTSLGKKSEQFKIVEYPLIILFVLTGAVLLISTNDLVSIFLAIELQSYGLYILSTIYRNSELSTRWINLFFTRWVKLLFYTIRYCTLIF